MKRAIKSRETCYFTVFSVFSVNNSGLIDESISFLDRVMLTVNCGLLSADHPKRWLSVAIKPTGFFLDCAPFSNEFS